MGASRATGWTVAAASLVLATGCAQAPDATGAAAAPTSTAQAVPVGSAAAAQQGQTPGPLQTITMPVGGTRTDVTAKLALNGYAGEPGQEFTFDASQSEGPISKYEWDLDGDGTIDRTTTSPVLKHTYTEAFDGQVVLRVSGQLGSTDTLRVPIHVGGADPRHTRLAPPTDVRAEAVSADGTEVKLTWKSDDTAVDSWGIAVNGIPVARAEKAARSFTVTDVRRSNDVLLEVFGITADFTLGERAGTTLPAR